MRSRSDIVSKCDSSHVSRSHHLPHHEATTASPAQILQPSMFRLPYLSNHLMGIFTQYHGHLLLALSLTSSNKPNTRACPPLLTCFAIHHALTASYPAHTQGQPSRLRSLGDYTMSCIHSHGILVCRLAQMGLPNAVSPPPHQLTRLLPRRCSTYPWASSAKHKMKQASPFYKMFSQCRQCRNKLLHLTAATHLRLHPIS